MSNKLNTFNVRDAFKNDSVTRYLVLGTLTSAIGEGMYYVCSALFFMKIVGMSPTELGLSLTIAWTVGLIMSVPLGHKVDKWGARKMTIVLMVIAGLAVASYLFIRSIHLFIVAAIIFAICSRGASSARIALLAISVKKENRTKVRAFLISTLNAGLAIGAGFGGLVLFFNTEASFLTAFSLNSLTYFIGAIFIFFVPSSGKNSTEAVSESKMWEVLRDKPFVVASVLNAILCLHFPLIDVALPVWVLTHTSAPLWVVSLTFLVNTTMVVIFQINVAKGIHSITDAKAHLRVSGVLLFSGCAMYALSSASDVSWIASSVLLLGAVTLTVGEMYQTVSTSEIAFELTPPGRHGQYQAFYGLGFSFAEAAGPLILTSLVVFGGWGGWLILGGMFLSAALLFGPTVDWALRSRETQKVIVR